MRLVGVPFTRIAKELGKVVVKNVVALGALQAATNLFTRDTFLTALRQALKEKIRLAVRLGFRRSVLLFIAVELGLLVTIRDGLVLNVLMLVCPIDAIRAWQIGR